MTEDELRTKIAKAFEMNITAISDDDRAGVVIKGYDDAADAIVALVLPAIQAARVEALREAEEALKPFDTAWVVACERLKNPALAEAETMAKHHLLGGSINRAVRAYRAIAALIEKETAP